MKSFIRNPYFVFFAILTLFLIYRSAMVLFLFNKILRVEGTEWNSVMLANDILNRGEDFLFLLKNPIRLFNYTNVICNGGLLFDSILYFFIALVFGINVLSLKILAVGYSLLTLVLGMLFLYRCFSLKAMTYFGLLYIFASPVFTRWSLTLYQPSASANYLFILFSLIFYLRVVKEQSSGSKRFYLALFAFWSGLMCFYQYTFVILLFAVFLDLLFCRRENFTFLNLIIFAAFFLLGCFPFYINFFMVNDFFQNALPAMKYTFMQYDDKAYNIAAGGTGGMCKFLLNFLNRGGQSLLFYPKLSPMWGTGSFLFFSNAFCKSFMFVSCFKIFQKYKTYTIFCFYIISYYIAVAAASMDFEVYRYWLSLYPVIYIVFAIMLSFLGEKKYKKTLTIVFLILLSFGVFDTYKIFTYSHSSALISKFDGLSYYLNHDISNVDEENIDDVNAFLKLNKFKVQKGMAYTLSGKETYACLLGFNLVFEVLDPNYPYLYNGAVKFSEEEINTEIFTKRAGEVFLAFADKKDMICFGLAWGLGIKYRWNKSLIEDFCNNISFLKDYKKLILLKYEEAFLQINSYRK